MQYGKKKAWFRKRWHVYEIAVQENNGRLEVIKKSWVASFKNQSDAETWTNSRNSPGISLIG